LRGEPTLSELESAARHLHWRLGNIVRKLEQAERNGEPCGTTWPLLPEYLVDGDTAHAVIEYARRSTMKQRRVDRGRSIAVVAMRFVVGMVDAREAIKQAILFRGMAVLKDGTTPARRTGADGSPVDAVSYDGHLEARASSYVELDTVVSKARTEETKWNAAYAYLARGAEVLPATDSARVLRGDRKKLFLLAKRCAG
jgi:hypothetical protein